MKIKPGEAKYSYDKQGKVFWNVKGKELAELTRFYYLQLCGMDQTLGMLRNDNARLREELQKIKKSKNKRKKK